MGGELLGSGNTLSSARSALRYLKVPVQKEIRPDCPLAMVLWLDEWVPAVIPYMTQAKKPFVGCCLMPWSSCYCVCQKRSVRDWKGE